MVSRLCLLAMAGGEVNKITPPIGQWMPATRSISAMAKLAAQAGSDNLLDAEIKIFVCSHYSQNLTVRIHLFNNLI